MIAISFPDLSDRTAEVEATRQGVATLDYDALSMTHFSLIDVSAGGVTVRISHKPAGFVARSTRLPDVFPAAEPMMQDPDEGVVGTYPTRSAAVAAVSALFSTVAGV